MQEALHVLCVVDGSNAGKKPEQKGEAGRGVHGLRRNRRGGLGIGIGRRIGRCAAVSPCVVHGYVLLTKNGALSGPLAKGAQSAPARPAECHCCRFGMLITSHFDFPPSGVDVPDCEFPLAAAPRPGAATFSRAASCCSSKSFSRDFTS